MHPSRRSCDLCYRKKIKCDSQTPRCSSCVIYQSDCTYRAASRKTPSRKQAAIQRQNQEEDLQSRVKTLEDQLSTVLEKVERLERSSSLDQDASTSVLQAISEEDVGLANPNSGLPLLELPPYQDVLPIVERYLTTFNSIFPLFHPGTLLQTVNNWYLSPNSQNPVIWAMINVVLALAHHTSYPGDAVPTGNTTTYLNNAQSVLTEVIMRETDLINVQVLLGLVILFWTADDLKPALVLISTALRLAHQLGLHTKKASRHCSPDVAVQRDRVFWMAYILDRDISLCSRLAPIQLESEIDLDMPPSDAIDDLTGFVCAPNGLAKMNFFRARIELGRIQGKVYGYVYSTQSQNLSSEERAQWVTYILRMLDDWRSQIPLEFHTSRLSQTNVSRLSRRFCILYSTYLSSRALISFGSAWDSFHYSRWLRRLQDYGDRVATGQVVSSAPVPQGWQVLVKECREYMRLYATVTPRDPFFIRMTLCAHNSSLLSLVANTIFNTHHGTNESDKHLIETAMLFSDDIAKQTGSDAMDIRNAVVQLKSYADLISQSI
ncbi:hypothetical protein M434DRAFT_378957 [Hypoxylon sp. CO27-5]|nr:hypothetical protein M434DRAFT_378957 [Hypoxylon sp. CO27-5]